MENHRHDVEEFKKRNLSVKENHIIKQYQDNNKNQEYRQIKTACLIEKKNILKSVKEEIKKNILEGKKQLKEQINKQDLIGKNAFYGMKINQEIKEAVNNKLSLVHETIKSSKNSTNKNTSNLKTKKLLENSNKNSENKPNNKEKKDGNYKSNNDNKIKKNQTIQLPLYKSNVKQQKISNTLNDEKLLEFFEKREEELKSRLKDLKTSYKCE